MLEAPWIGLCREESHKHKPEFIGYCSSCGESLYDNDECISIRGSLYCEECAEEWTEE